MQNTKAICLMIRELCAELKFKMLVKGHSQVYMPIFYSTIGKVLT